MMLKFVLWNIKKHCVDGAVELVSERASGVGWVHCWWEFTPSLDIHVELLLLCWFRKIFNVETIIKTEFCKISKPKLNFRSARWLTDDTSCVRCFCVWAIFAHDAVEPIALTFSIETRRSPMLLDRMWRKLGLAGACFGKLSLRNRSTDLSAERNDRAVPDGKWFACAKAFLCRARLCLSDRTAAARLESFVTATA